MMLFVICFALVLVACNDTQKVTVTFNTMGGSEIKERVITKGTKVEKPEDPKKDDYTFAQWYEQEAYTTEYKFNKTVDKDITLFAKLDQAIDPTMKATVSSGKLTWDTVADVKAYKVVISSQNEVVKTEIVTTTSLDLQPLNLAVGTYTIVVSALDQQDKAFKTSNIITYRVLSESDINNLRLKLLKIHDETYQLNMKQADFQSNDKYLEYVRNNKIASIYVDHYVQYAIAETDALEVYTLFTKGFSGPVEDLETLYQKLSVFSELKVNAQFLSNMMVSVFNMYQKEALESATYRLSEYERTHHDDKNAYFEDWYQLRDELIGLMPENEETLTTFFSESFVAQNRNYIAIFIHLGMSYSWYEPAEYFMQLEAFIDSMPADVKEKFTIFLEYAQYNETSMRELFGKLSRTFLIANEWYVSTDRIATTEKLIEQYESLGILLAKTETAEVVEMLLTYGYEFKQAMNLSTLLAAEDSLKNGDLSAEVMILKNEWVDILRETMPSKASFATLGKVLHGYMAVFADETFDLTIDEAVSVGYALRSSMNVSLLALKEVTSEHLEVFGGLINQINDANYYQNSRPDLILELIVEIYDFSNKLATKYQAEFTEFTNDTKDLGRLIYETTLKQYKLYLTQLYYAVEPSVIALLDAFITEYELVARVTDINQLKPLLDYLVTSDSRVIKTFTQLTKMNLENSTFREMLESLVLFAREVKDLHEILNIELSADHLSLIKMILKALDTEQQYAELIESLDASLLEKINKTLNLLNQVLSTILSDATAMDFDAYYQKLDDAKDVDEANAIMQAFGLKLFKVIGTDSLFETLDEVIDVLASAATNETLKTIVEQNLDITIPELVSNIKALLNEAKTDMQSIHEIDETYITYGDMRLINEMLLKYLGQTTYIYEDNIQNETAYALSLELAEEVTFDNKIGSQLFKIEISEEGYYQALNYSTTIFDSTFKRIHSDYGQCYLEAGTYYLAVDGLEGYNRSYTYIFEQVLPYKVGERVVI